MSDSYAILYTLIVWISNIFSNIWVSYVDLKLF